MKIRKEKVPDELDVLIAKAHEKLRLAYEDTEEYSKTLTSLERLEAIKGSNKPKRALDRDGVVSVLGNLLGIAMIIGYEHSHVITTKAFGTFIKRSDMIKRG